MKITIRYYYSLIRVAKFETLATPNAGKDVEQKKLSFMAGGNAGWHSQCGRQFGGFL